MIYDGVNQIVGLKKMFGGRTCSSLVFRSFVGNEWTKNLLSIVLFRACILPLCLYDDSKICAQMLRDRIPGVLLALIAVACSDITDCPFWRIVVSGMIGRYQPGFDLEQFVHE